MAGGTRSLGRLVVQLAAEIAQYRRDWDQAVQTTEQGAQRVEQASKRMDGAADTLRDTIKRQAGAMGEAAGAVAEYGGAAQAATGATGAMVVGVGAAVAALGTLAVAAYKGAQEQKALNDALLLTGNYAGVVAGEIDRMALRTASAIGGTVGNARQVLAGLVSTGRFTRESLEEVAGAVQLVARYSGQTNEQVLKDFAGMADGVAKWAAKHNEAYHFLDLATFKYIKQLEDQGRQQDAVRAASEALSKHLGSDLTQNLGILERSWLSVQRAASSAWAAMKDLGKETTTQQRIDQLSQYLQNSARGWMRPNAGTAAMQQQLRDLIRRNEIEVGNASARSYQEQADQAAIDALMGKGSKASAGAKGVDPYEALLKNAQERVATMKLELDGTEKLTEAERLRAKYMADLANGYIKFNAVKDRTLQATLAELDASEKASRARKQEAQEEIEARNSRLAALESIRKKTDSLQQDTDQEIEHARSIGLSKDQIAELTAAKLEDLAASADRKASLLEETELDTEMAEAYRREADAARKLADAKRQSAARETEQDQAKEVLRNLRDADDLARRVFAEMADSGSSAAHTIGRALKTQVIDLLYQMTARRWVVQIVAGNGGAGGGAAGGGGLLNNASSLSNLVGGGAGWTNTIANGASALGFTNFAAGMSGVGGSFASSVGAGLATDAMGATVAEGAAAATLGSTGAAAGSAVAAAIPVIGWVVAIGALLYSIFGKKGGGPKSEGYYNPYNGDQYYSSNNGEVANAARGAAQGLQAQYDDLVRMYSGTGGLQFGVGFSTDPRGTAPSQAHVGVGSNGATLFNVADTNVGRSQEDLQAAIAKLGAEAMLRGLQQSNLSGIIGDYLRSLGDVANLSADQVTAAIARIQKAAQEKSQLDETWFQLTHTAEENLAHQREKELNALDISNRAMAVRIYALQDEIDAQAKAKALYAEITDEIASLQVRIGAFIDRLNASPAGLLSPEQQLANAKTQFNQQLGLARGGDRNALQSITDYADQLIAAQVAFSASGGDTAALIGQVKDALAVLPQQVNAEEFVANAVQDGAFLLNASIQQLIARADANAAAQIAAINGEATAQAQAEAQAAAGRSAAAAAAAAQRSRNDMAGWTVDENGYRWIGPGPQPGPMPGMYWQNGTPYTPETAAAGGVFSNSIVSGPTPFLTKSGRQGLMGEAGDEGVFPLVDVGGKLGVMGFTGAKGVEEKLAAVLAQLEVLTTAVAAGARGTISQLTEVAENTRGAVRSATLRASEAAV